MKYKVDYLSYTYIANEADTRPPHLLDVFIWQTLPAEINRSLIEIISVKRPGMDRAYKAGEGTYIFANRRGLVLIEHTGQGCDLLEENGVLLETIKRVHGRITRLDLAVDLHTDVTPAEFVSKRGETKVTARGTQISKSGATEYIGSRKSDRTCKVYRYFGRHPRAHLLRIEYTYRKEQANVAAHFLLTEGLEKTVQRSGAAYAWEHPVYTASVDEPIPAWRPERRNGKTVAWIYSQCIPAITRLINEGVLTLDEIIDEINEGLK